MEGKLSEAHEVLQELLEEQFGPVPSTLFIGRQRISRPF